MVTDDLRKFIVDGVDWSGSLADLTDTYPLLEREVLDSMAIFNLVAYLEETYLIEIMDEDLVPENFETIEAIARLVTQRRA